MNRHNVKGTPMSAAWIENRIENARGEKVEKGGHAPDYHPLRFRSTGLGKTMLEGKPAGVTVVDDVLIMHIQSTAPVRWQIRAALSYRGLLQFLRLALKPSVITFVLFGWRTLKKPRMPEDF